jgi:hypothetical protein
MLGGRLPSPDALLDFLGQFHDPACWAQRPADKLAYVPPESAGLRGLETINRELIARGAARTTTRATIDHDGTIIEAHKREATVAYEGTRGYQPLVAAWAEEQLIVADEFRDGNVSGGEDPLSSAKRAMDNLPPWVKERYFRGDSASYYAPLLKYLVAEGIGFTISADMTKELRACCLAVPADEWVELENRGTERVDLAEVEFTPGDWPKQALPLRYVAVRFTPLQGEMFGSLTPKHLAIVSNRAAVEMGALVRWHWEKAGTIEHVGANAAWFRINALTYNVLTVLKRRALPERLRDARPKRLRFELFTLPAKLSVHQSQLSIHTSAREERLQEIVAARGRLLAMRQAHRAGPTSTHVTE